MRDYKSNSFTFVVGLEVDVALAEDSEFTFSEEKNPFF